MLDFHAIRQWLSLTYGQTYEIGTDAPGNEHWSFELKQKDYSIYLKGDDELSWFKVKYGA
jgi:hypothetical protein